MQTPIDHPKDDQRLACPWLIIVQGEETDYSSGSSHLIATESNQIPQEIRTVGTN